MFKYPCILYIYYFVNKETKVIFQYRIQNYCTVHFVSSCAIQFSLCNTYLFPEHRIILELGAIQMRKRYKNA